jgi:hypothetical protein
VIVVVDVIVVVVVVVDVIVVVVDVIVVVVDVVFLCNFFLCIVFGFCVTDVFCTDQICVLALRLSAYCIQAALSNNET